MPFTQLFYHVVWATERRQPLIAPEIDGIVHKAVRDKAEALGAVVYAVGGVEDHIHLAVGIPTTIALAKFIGDVKGASAHHINHTPDGTHRLNWQRGYGVLTFSRDRLDVVLDYIRNQKQHHADQKLRKGLENCGEDNSVGKDAVREERAQYVVSADEDIWAWELGGLGVEPPV